MILLLASAILWVGVHVGIAGTAVRARLVGMTGEAGFRIGFSLLSGVSITLLVLAWRAAPYVPLWSMPPGFRWFAAPLMLLVFLFFVASLATPNPTAVGGGGLGAAGPRGVQRITRHPMLWSFAIWAALHLVAKGDLAGILFFGAFLATALVGMPSIDRKLAARDPAIWARLAPGTSILPFGAILAGRTALVWAEIPQRVWIIGVAAWLAALILHPWIFGYRALPF